MTDGNKFLSRRFQAASRCFILIARELFAVAVPPHFGVILTDNQGWSPTWVLMDPLVPESKSDFSKTPNIKKIASAGSLVPYGVRISMSGATCWKCEGLRVTIWTAFLRRAKVACRES